MSVDPESSNYQTLMVDQVNQVTAINELRELSIDKYNRHVDDVNDLEAGVNSNKGVKDSGIQN